MGVRGGRGRDEKGFCVVFRCAGGVCHRAKRVCLNAPRPHTHTTHTAQHSTAQHSTAHTHTQSRWLSLSLCLCLLAQHSQVTPVSITCTHVTSNPPVCAALSPPLTKTFYNQNSLAFHLQKSAVSLASSAPHVHPPPPPPPPRLSVLSTPGNPRQTLQCCPNPPLPALTPHLQYSHLPSPPPHSPSKATLLPSAHAAAERRQRA